MVVVHGSNLTSIAIGDGEAALRRYFDDAASRAPAVSGVCVCVKCKHRII